MPMLLQRIPQHLFKLILLAWFPDADFNVINTTGPNLQVAYSPSTNVEAFFEGAQNVYEDAL